MNYPVAILIACATLFATKEFAAARSLNCTREAVDACKVEAAQLCRDLPKGFVDKCLDDLHEECATPDVLCGRRSPNAFAFPRWRCNNGDEDMVINPDPKGHGVGRICWWQW
jgi:hypothetical protein